MQKKEETVGAFIESLVDGAFDPPDESHHRGDQQRRIRDPPDSYPKEEQHRLPDFRRDQLHFNVQIGAPRRDPLASDPRRDHQRLSIDSGTPVIRIVPAAQANNQPVTPGQKEYHRPVISRQESRTDAQARDDEAAARGSFPGINDRRASIRPHYASLPVIPVAEQPASSASVKYDPDAVFDNFFENLFLDTAATEQVDDVGRQSSSSPQPSANSPPVRTGAQAAPVLIIPWREGPRQPAQPDRGYQIASADSVGVGDGSSKLAPEGFSVEPVQAVPKANRNVGSLRPAAPRDSFQLSDSNRLESVGGEPHFQQAAAAKQYTNHRAPILINVFPQGGYPRIGTYEDQTFGRDEDQSLGRDEDRQFSQYEDEIFGGRDEDVNIGRYEDHHISHEEQDISRDKDSSRGNLVEPRGPVGNPSQQLLLDSFVESLVGDHFEGGGRGDHSMSKEKMMEHLSHMMMMTDKMSHHMAMQGAEAGNSGGGEGKVNIVVFSGGGGADPQQSDPATSDFISENIVAVSGDKVTVTADLYESIFGEEDSSGTRNTGSLSEADQNRSESSPDLAHLAPASKSTNKLILLPLSLQTRKKPGPTKGVSVFSKGKNDHSVIGTEGLDKSVSTTSSSATQVSVSETRKNFRVIVVNPFKDGFLPALSFTAQSSESRDEYDKTNVILDSPVGADSQPGDHDYENDSEEVNEQFPPMLSSGEEEVLLSVFNETLGATEAHNATEEVLQDTSPQPLQAGELTNEFLSAEAHSESPDYRDQESTFIDKPETSEPSDRTTGSIDLPGVRGNTSYGSEIMKDSIKDSFAEMSHEKNESKVLENTGIQDSSPETSHEQDSSAETFIEQQHSLTHVAEVQDSKEDDFPSWIQQKGLARKPSIPAGLYRRPKNLSGRYGSRKQAVPVFLPKLETSIELPSSSTGECCFAPCSTDLLCRFFCV